jgi:hypothetical protein
MFILLVLAIQFSSVGHCFDLTAFGCGNWDFSFIRIKYAVGIWPLQSIRTDLQHHQIQKLFFKPANPRLIRCFKEQKTIP